MDCHGGVIAGDTVLIERLRRDAAAFGATSPSPLPAAAAAAVAWKIWGHDRPLRIRAEVGVRVDLQRGREVLARAPGVTFSATDRAFFAPEAIEAAFQQAPSAVDVYDRRDRFGFR